MNKDVQNLLEDRYFTKNETTWKQLADRVSTIYDPIKSHLEKMEFIPSSPTLMNWTDERVGTLSSCFPIEMDDSIEGIFETLKDSALITKYSGGIGFDFSKLRSHKESVDGLGGRVSSGPIPYIQIYNSMLDGVSQAGVRRGAGMAMLDIEHPDIIHFIEAKKDTSSKRFNRFNFSVRVSNKFYKLLEDAPDSIFQVQNVVDKKWENLEYNGGIITVKQLWDKIVELAWYSAEPGIFNSDIATRQCTVTNVNPNVLSNPCSEFTNIPYSSCALASINLSKLVKNKKFDWKAFENLTKLGTRFLDKTITVNNYPIKKIREVADKIRPIGLGYMGIAHALMKMEIPFASVDGLDFINEVSRKLTYYSMKESIELAKEVGKYPAFDFDLYNKANKRFFKTEEFQSLLPDLKKFGIRNSCQTSVAPNGSISFISETSSGIEPVFALGYQRKIEIGKDKDNNIIYNTVNVSDPVFEKYIKKHYANETEIIMDSVVKNNGSCQKCKILSPEEKEIFKIANDLSPMDHLNTLEKCAINTSLSVSKTINLPKSATKEDVAKVYIDAYKKGIIGVTVYRDGSREGVLVTSSDDKKETFIKTKAPKRPKSLESKLYHITLNKQKYYVVVSLFDNSPMEVFTGINYTDAGEVYIPSNVKSGEVIKKNKGTYIFKSEDNQEFILMSHHNHDTSEALTRQISLALRHGSEIHYIVEQLQKVKTGDMQSFSRILARVLKKYIPDNTSGTTKCETCGDTMVFESGCVVCKSCGNSKCG